MGEAHAISHSLKQTQGKQSKGEELRNKAARNGTEIGCLPSEVQARDIFRECLTSRVLELKALCL